MLKLVFDRFQIEMNEQDIARIISDFLISVSNNSVQRVLPYWKFEVVQTLDNGHDIAFSYRLRERDVKTIESCLKQFYSIDIKIEDVRPPYATDKYLIVYLPSV